MKKLINVICAVLAVLCMHQAQAGGISDAGVNGYWGADAHGLGDLIGAGTYDIQGATITRVGSVLTIAHASNFAGHTGSDAALALGGVGYGDLFLARTWNPYGTDSHHASDNASNGTKWTYGFGLDNPSSNTVKDTGLEGAWTVTADEELKFTLDGAKSELINFASFAMHWGETWQNNVVEGSLSMVPLPGSVPLLGLGLFAMLYVRRRKAG